MPKTQPHVHLIDGEYWFNIGSAAALLGLSKRKLQAKIDAGEIASLQHEKHGELVAEKLVTELRRAAMEKPKRRRKAAPPQPLASWAGSGRPSLLRENQVDQKVLDWSPHGKK